MNRETQVKLSKVLRYLRYYPHDLWQILRFWVRHQLAQDKSDRAFVEHLYQYFLKVEHPSDIEFYSKQLAQGSVSRLGLLCSFLMIPASWEQKLFHTQGNFSHHQARLTLVQTELPAAERILDLGGAAEHDPRGSLLAMGYPHHSKQIDIVDLPIEQRFFQSGASPIEQHTAEGTQIHYHYISMNDLSTFADRAFDLVWSGQSIEHITEAEADLVIQAVYRVLKPGGYFCLDTPNRQLTVLQVRQGYIHPEHKIEYVPNQLAAKLSDHGFRVVRQKAISPMPMSYKTGRFSRLELIHAIDLGDDPDLGYSFYLSAQKPFD